MGLSFSAIREPWIFLDQKHPLKPSNQVTLTYCLTVYVHFCSTVFAPLTLWIYSPSPETWFLHSAQKYLCEHYWLWHVVKWPPIMLAQSLLAVPYPSLHFCEQTWETACIWHQINAKCTMINERKTVKPNNKTKQNTTEQNQTKTAKHNHIM